MGKAFNLKNGTILLVTEAPGGLYNAAQLKKIATICDNNMAIVKATEDQRLALFVKEGDAAKIAGELKAIGLGIRHYQDGLHQPTACIGELCPDHDQDALGSAMALTKELADIQLKSPLKIGINGCASCCVPCHTLDISVVGDAGGYRIAMGGKNSALPEMASFMADNVPAEALAPLLKKVVALYQAQASDGETLQELMDRTGAGAFIGALAPYSQDASATSEDPFAGTELENGTTPAQTDDLDLSLDTEGLEDIGGTSAAEEGELDLGADLNIGEEPMDLSDTIHLEEDLGGGNLDIDVTGEMGSDAGLTADIGKLEKNWEENDQELLLEDDLLGAEPEEFSVELDEEFVPQEEGKPSAKGAPGFTAEDSLMEDSDFSLGETEIPLEFGDELAVAATPAMEVPTELAELETAVPEIGDDELGESFEAQLEESIAEEETFRAVEAADENSRDRDETLTLLEGGLDDIELLGNDPDEDLLRQAAMTAREPAPARPKASKEAAAGSLALSGMHVSPDNNLVLEFSNGALMTIAADKIPGGQKTLKFGSQVIQIDVLAEGYQVEADGISMFYPFGQMNAA